MFPDHVERSFLDPEYSFDEYFQLGSQRKVGPIKNQLASPNTSNYVREETFAQLRTGLRLLPQSYQDPNLSEGADRVGGQLRRDKECPFSGLTKSGRVWRKVPESDAQSVGTNMTVEAT